MPRGTCAAGFTAPLTCAEALTTRSVAIIGDCLGVSAAMRTDRAGSTIWVPYVARRAHATPHINNEAAR
jgi:hypothetical protein